jgi:hypothetical protein
MLFATLFAVPIWLAIPVYFGVGLLWAALYLPHAVARQARQYKKWKADILDGKTLEQAMTVPYRHSNHPLTPNQFMLARGEGKFTERAVLKGFIWDIAFWPLRILKLVVIDALRAVLEKLAECLADFWRLVFMPVLRWVGRMLRYIWLNLIVEAYRWGYDRVVRVYQSIITQANREAIADMEILNRAPKETKQ